MKKKKYINKYLFSYLYVCINIYLLEEMMQNELMRKNQ